MPWNFSVITLESFLISSRFCKEDVGALESEPS
jgi:hypothetical protein